MMREVVKISIAMSMWVAAVVLMTVATALYSGPLILAGWAILLALAGSVLIGWQLLSLEQARTEHIARIAAERTVAHLHTSSIP